MTDLRRWPGADALLDEALALPRDARDEFIGRVTADPGLAAALRAVLREAEIGDGFLAPDEGVASALADALETAAAAGDARDALQPGRRVEHYEIVALVGRGGMGEVYRARDTRLGRDVALKVLPQAYAADPERRARFQREARVLASLSHPGIGAIYGVAETQGIEALVLEYVEGPTLAERLAHGPLTLGEAIRIGRHVVDALEAAHARGVLHRDLKPANIKVRPDGSVTILDFGLAKALAAEETGEGPADLTGQTPFALLGTAAYMSPEQVRRERVDQRADIWAFGCVLFELLTGTRAFPGRPIHEVLAGVLEREPAYSLLPPETPAALRRLLRRTLDKDPTRRLGFIGDARLELEDAAQPPLLDREGASDAPPRRRWRVPAGIGLAAGAIAALGVAWLARPAPPAPATARFVVPLEDAEPVKSYQPMIAVAPDGQTIAYRARADGRVRVFLRRLADLAVTPLPGTDGATGLFFSPDGRWLGFDSDGVIKRVAVDGSGAPIVIGPAPGGVTASWGADDTVIFATNTRRVLERLPVGGGSAEPLTALDAARGDTLHLLPQALPGGRVLFTIAAGRARHVALADGGGRISVLTDGTHGRLVGTDTLVFLRERTLFGQRVDVAAGAVRGPAVPLVDGIDHTDRAVGHYDAAAGTLAYLPAGQIPAPRRELVWIDRSGRQTRVPGDPRAFTRLSLSPDGTRVAIGIEEDGNTDIWVVDLTRGTATPLTTEPAIDAAPAWSPDGQWIAFRSERERPGLFRRDAQGAGPIEQLTATDGPIHSPSSWSPDGRTLFFALFRSYRQQAIARVVPPDPAVTLLLDGEYAHFGARLSPDSRWLAYQSDESGRMEVVVRPYPALTTGRWQVSAGGGTSPHWTADGRELIYLNDAGLWAMPVRPGATFSVAPARRLFDVAPFGTRLGADFDLSPDGRQFLFVLSPAPEARRSAQFVVARDWDSEVGRRMAEGR